MVPQVGKAERTPSLFAEASAASPGSGVGSWLLFSLGRHMGALCSLASGPGRRSLAQGLSGSPGVHPHMNTAWGSTQTTSGHLHLGRSPSGHTGSAGHAGTRGIQPAPLWALHGPQARGSRLVGLSWFPARS